MKKLLLLLLLLATTTHPMMFGPGAYVNWATQVPGNPKEPYCERRKWRRACRTQQQPTAPKHRGKHARMVQQQEKIISEQPQLQPSAK